MTGAEDPDPRRRDEQTLDRELDELTSELRTAVPGATVLLAFLLTVPFASGFPTLDVVQRAAYFLAFLSTAVAVVFLLGEAAYHRLCGKPYDKGGLIRTASRQLVVALVLLACALSSAVFLVTDLLFGAAASVPVTGVVAGLVLVVWFGLPLSRRR